jgi:hypothetical protein
MLASWLYGWMIGALLGYIAIFGRTGLSGWNLVCISGDAFSLAPTLANPVTLELLILRDSSLARITSGGTFTNNRRDISV